MTEESKKRQLSDKLRHGKKDNREAAELRKQRQKRISGKSVLRKSAGGLTTAARRIPAPRDGEQDPSLAQQGEEGLLALGKAGISAGKKAASRWQNSRYQNKMKAGKHAAENSALDGGSHRQSRHLQRKQYQQNYTSSSHAPGKISGSHQMKQTARGWKKQLQGIPSDRKKKLVFFLVPILLMIFLISQLQSCALILSGGITSLSSVVWPASDSEISRADAYYTKKEAELRQQIEHLKQSGIHYDEYRCQLDPIGHDPVTLISYLSAKYQNFTLEDVTEELDTLFSLQYQLTVDSIREEHAAKQKRRVGDSLGIVTTSGYCNCVLCCGSWAGGPTASGPYPTSSHTLAVDAANPAVPLGTEIIMNGNLYKVEDTGNFSQYGVTFDVYYDEHDTAEAHGHQKVEAFLAGGDGEEIEVTSISTSDVCQITLKKNDLGELLTGRLSAEETARYLTYQTNQGGRVCLESPVAADWRQSVTMPYGYRYDPEKDQVLPHSGMTFSVSPGTEILSMTDGTVLSVSDDTLAIKDHKSCSYILSGCASIQVKTGETVTAGQPVAAAGDTLRITLYQKNNSVPVNPWFYMKSGSESPAEPDTEKGTVLIEEARKYLGTPYVWGGYSPGGFDCSGFVSYSMTHSGVLNTGHLTCDGLIGLCTRVPKDQLRPGDLVFFQGTYETAPPSHTGIYIGSGTYGKNTFIHCGDPCQYGNLASSYWVDHWYTGGRWY